MVESIFCNVIATKGKKKDAIKHCTETQAKKYKELYEKCDWSVEIQRFKMDKSLTD